MAGSELRVPRAARERALQFVGAALGMTASGTAMAGTSALVKGVLVSVSLGAVGGGLASLTASQAFSYFERKQPAYSEAAVPRGEHRKIDAKPRAAGPIPSSPPEAAVAAAPELAATGDAAPTAALAATDEVAPAPVPARSAEQVGSEATAPARSTRNRVTAGDAASIVSTAPPLEPARPSLFEEQRAIDSARAAITNRDFRTALATLDEYERRYQRRQFGPEALALRVQALVGSNQLEAARSLAREFEQRYPHHPLLSRVQTSVAR
jgi:hypothetical protein